MTQEEFCRVWEVSGQTFRRYEAKGLTPVRVAMPGERHPQITRGAMLEWLARLAGDRERTGRPYLKWPLPAEGHEAALVTLLRAAKYRPDEIARGADLFRRVRDMGVPAGPAKELTQEAMRLSRGAKRKD